MNRRFPLDRPPVFMDNTRNMDTINTTTETGSMILISDLAPVWGITLPGTHQYIKNNGFKSIVLGARAYLPPSEARKAMMSRGLSYKRQVISVQMLKGGVGKTSIALNVGIRAAMYGARVLLVDLDQQANLSFAFGIVDENAFVWVDLLENKCTIKDIIRQCSDNIHIVPSNLNNSVLDKQILTGKRNVATAVSQYIDQLNDLYDFVIIDTAPNLSAINTSAACSSDIVLLPVTPDKFSFDGLKKTIDDLEDIRTEFGATFINKILFNKFDARETSSHQLLKTCIAEYSDIMLRAFIRTSSDVKNTIRTGKTVFEKRSAAKEDYDVVTRELMGFA